MPRIISINNIAEAKEELSKIGSDKSSVIIMASKAVFRAIKVSAIKPVAANIIKQEMLSRGGEVAVSRGAINQSVKTTDILILGTLRQFVELLNKLRKHQFGLPQLAEDIGRVIGLDQNAPPPIKIGRKTFRFGRRTYIMGIVNVTPDSFSDGGKFLGLEAAVERACQLEKEGADIIDIGGESSRPGARGVKVEVEVERVVPVIRKLKRKLRIPISIDTTKSIVAEKAVRAGAHMINDISGLNSDKKMASVAAKHNVPIVLMHMKGDPRTMQKDPKYRDVAGEIIDHLSSSMDRAVSAGVKKDKIVLDPGIGFGKTLEHNLEILRKLGEFRSLGRPLLIGTSRKSLIGQVLDLPVDERIEGTLATVVASIVGKADIVRVHDVKSVRRAAKMADAVLRK